MSILDEEVHPQIRFTTRLEYFNAVDNMFEHEYIYMNSEQYDRQFYEIIAQKKEEINWDLISYGGTDSEITEWYDDTTENNFSRNEILSNDVISLLQNDEYAQILNRRDCEPELSLAYLNEISFLYTKAQVAKAILSVVSRKPNVEIVKRILSVWDVTINRDTNVEMQLKMIVNSNAMDMALGKMLKVNNSENLRMLKAKLEHLFIEWHLEQETDSHKRMILLYKFFNECPIIDRNKVSLKEGLETVSIFLKLPNTTYTKEVQFTKPIIKKDKDGKDIQLTDPMEKRKARIYSEINSQWASFKARHLK